MKYAVIAGLLIAAMQPAFSASMIDDRKLEQMASSASAPSEHAAVAKQYRLRAEALEEKARMHEAEARKLADRPKPAMAHKWPALYRGPEQKEKELAVQARRAALEAQMIADRHVRLAVEAMAVD